MRVLLYGICWRVALRGWAKLWSRKIHNNVSLCWSEYAICQTMPNFLLQSLPPAVVKGGCFWKCTTPSTPWRNRIRPSRSHCCLRYVVIDKLTSEKNNCWVTILNKIRIRNILTHVTAAPSMIKTNLIKSRSTENILMKNWLFLMVRDLKLQDC